MIGEIKNPWLRRLFVIAMMPVAVLIVAVAAVETLYRGVADFLHDECCGDDGIVYAIRRAWRGPAAK